MADVAPVPAAAGISPEEILGRYRRARDRRLPCEGVWQECYDHVMARLPGSGGPALYDGTAADAVEQLAASLLAELTPPWSRWVGLRATRAEPDLDSPAAIAEARAVETAAETLQGHIDRSNFAMEMHQAFLDLVIAGTGVLLVEEAPPGEASALRFTAVPLREAVLEEGVSGRLDTVYRTARLSPATLLSRFPRAVLPRAVRDRATEGEAAFLEVVEAVWPDAAPPGMRAPGSGYRYAAVLDDAGAGPVLLAEGRFAENPFVGFRWLKAPGESYGRGPVAKALPDIRTANKVVELVLKNASIAATGIWQADDDGVLNPATVRLVPGAIIPKAPGSAGLTPLAAPGNFNVSQIVLEDLRGRIRHALLADRLGPTLDARMTATEVLERSAETARLLGATYGRLQAELLTPLLLRCLSVLRRRGEVPAYLLDGQRAAVRFASPLARVQGREDAANALLFLKAVAGIGPAATAQIDPAGTTRWLARTLGVPVELLVGAVPASPEPAARPTPAANPSAPQE
ncbi:portal protein [Roseomonas sp. NAR14]|uniref:Portal protein n=1 Tax=Roseomonas acroporae TaxID=2937791 RepID=A0A9X1Y736_9PROT|nr:portal protein [Roseomonas acroporae]MCK8784327.1 portal protein [Roseomonas acroporae]